MSHVTLRKPAWPVLTFTKKPGCLKELPEVDAFFNLLEETLDKSSYRIFNRSDDKGLLMPSNTIELITYDYGDGVVRAYIADWMIKHVGHANMMTLEDETTASANLILVGYENKFVEYATALSKIVPISMLANNLIINEKKVEKLTIQFHAAFKRSIFINVEANEYIKTIKDKIPDSPYWVSIHTKLTNMED